MTSKNIYYQSYDEDTRDFNVAVTILLLFVPQFLLSLFSTLNLRDKSSLKILYRQPSLIILPTVTFFTFSKIKIKICRPDCSLRIVPESKNDKINHCCDNSQVMFSKKITWVNMLVSSVGYASWVFSCYFAFNGQVFQKQIKTFSMFTFIPLAFSILLTALFLHLDKLPCCNPREQLSVYDPDLDKRFIMLDGEVVEDPEDDVETTEDDVETCTCCGWCRQTEKQQSEHVTAIEVTNRYFSSSENPPKVYDDEHLLLAKIDEDDVAGVDLPDNLHKAAAAAPLMPSETEGKYPDTEGEITDTGEHSEMVNIAMPMRQSENEAVDIVTELIDNIITDIL